MKKISFVLVVLLFILFLVGCSSTSPATSTGDSGIVTFDNESDSDTSDLALTTSQQTYQFDEPRSDSMYGSYAFEVTNTLDIPIRVDNYTVDFLDKDGNIIGHQEDVNLISRVMQPGDKAYAGEIISIETSTNPDDIKAMEVNLNTSKISKTSEMFDFEKLNLMESNDGESLSVTGKVINNTSSDAELASIVIVSLGENDKLLDVTYVGSVYKLAKGAESSFDASLNNSSIKKNDIKQIFALGYDFSKTM